MNNFKKIICLLIAVLVSAGFFACQTTTSYEVKNQIIEKLKTYDFAAGKTTVNITGDTVGVDGTLLYDFMSPNNAYDFYLMFYQNSDNVSERQKRATVISQRGDKTYTLQDSSNDGSVYISIASSNYLLEVKNRLSLGASVKMMQVTDETSLYRLVKAAIMLLSAYPQSNKLELPLPFSYSLFLNNDFILQSTDAVSVHDGYRLSVDMVALIKDKLQDLVSVGEYVDNNPEVTVGMLYESQIFTDSFKLLLTSLSASFVKEYLQNFIDSAPEDLKNAVTLLDEGVGENGYDYLGRFIETKAQGLTISSMRVMDLAVMFGKEETQSLKSYFNTIKNNRLDLLKMFTDSLKIVYFFDNDLNFVKLSADFYLKTDEYYENEVFVFETLRIKTEYTTDTKGEVLLTVN